MPTAVSSIIRAATRDPDEPLKVLTFPTHERYESGLCQSGHDFYAYRDKGIKDWNRLFAPVPNNYTLLSPRYGENQIPPDVDFDVILSQNKFGQFPIAKQMSSLWCVPLVSLEHTLPHPSWPEGHTAQLRNQKGDVNVFLSEYSQQAWGWNDSAEIIAPGIDDATFTPQDFLPKKPVVLSVVNDWINRDWACGFNLWRQVTKDLPVSVLGDTPGLSKAAESTNHLVNTYRTSQVFLNTSLVSTCPFTLLEAMSCGCAVVSTATTMIPQIIKNGVNGFCSNEPAELRYRCQQLLGNPELAEKLGREARRTIEESFSFRHMAASWNKVLKAAANIVVTGEK